MCPSCAPASQTWSSSPTLLLPGDLMISMVCDATFAHTRARGTALHEWARATARATPRRLLSHHMLHSATLSPRNALPHTCTDTVDYTRVLDDVRSQMLGPSKKLIEALACGIAQQASHIHLLLFSSRLFLPPLFPHGSRARCARGAVLGRGGALFWPIRRTGGSCPKRISSADPHAIRTPSAQHPHAISTPSPLLRAGALEPPDGRRSPCAHPEAAGAKKNVCFCLFLNVAPPLLPFANLRDVFEFLFLQRQLEKDKNTRNTRTHRRQHMHTFWRFLF